MHLVFVVFCYCPAVVSSACDAIAVIIILRIMALYFFITFSPSSSTLICQQAGRIVTTGKTGVTLLKNFHQVSAGLEFLKVLFMKAIASAFKHVFKTVI